MADWMPFGLEPGAAAILGFGLLVASFVRGYSGFGFSALLVSTGALVTNPALVVPLAMLYEVAATAGQAKASIASTRPEGAAAPAATVSIAWRSVRPSSPGP